MTIHTRILGIALCLLLASATDALAASKRKSGGRGKATTKSHDTKVVPNGTSDGSPVKPGAAPIDARAIDNRVPVRESVRQESRIEFDERMLRGQSAAGVIYLFQRTPSDWKSIVEVPDSFRLRTVNVLTSGEDKK
jgi:hypothetical protein